MRDLRAYAAACVAVGTAAIAPSAWAGTASGGSYASAPAVVQAVACRADCVDEETVKPGSTVRLSGQGMHRVRSVIFLGGPGDADDKLVPALRWAKTIADVKVPDGAVTGRVRARNGDGALARPSADVVTVGTAEQIAAPPPAAATGPAPAPGTGPAPTPAAADRDTSDRLDARVETNTVFYAGYRKAVLRYVVTGDGPLDVAVELVRLPDGAALQRWSAGGVAPGAQQQIAWDGLVDGTPVPEGRYEFRVHPVAAAAAQDGGEPPVVADSFRFLDHKFPVRGKHDYGGAIAGFGAGRAGHSHQGQDVFADCGTPLVAARGGVVRYKAFQSRAGNYVVIDGDGTDVDYAYMHLQGPALVDKGDRVMTGQRLGNVGDTGDARGCHLHFEAWSGPGWYEGGKPFDPLALLRAWDAQSGALTPR
jgi:murein DD-endopeptidase MepM/ murein hydrolase activator NlpD